MLDCRSPPLLDSLADYRFSITYDRLSRQVCRRFNNVSLMPAASAHVALAVIAGTAIR